MKPRIAIIGGGAAGLFFAAHIDTDLYDVSLYEQNNQLGRKLLVAGKGGFNLSHSEPIDQLISRYTPDSFLKKALLEFDNETLRAWFKSNQIPTFIGSSRRIFPLKGFKPIEVLNMIIKSIEKNNVKIHTNHKWLGNANSHILRFDFNGKKFDQDFDYVVYALGGASWKVTGSNGEWLKHFKSSETIPFAPSNCSYKVNWPDALIAHSEGKPLKNINITCSGETKTGELMVTRFGLEGSSIYALSPKIRQAITAHGQAMVYIDLKPEFSQSKINERLKQPYKKSWTNHIQSVLNLSKEKMKLLKSFTTFDDFNAPERLARFIKSLPIRLIGMAPIDEAISTVGGISLEAVNTKFELIDQPQHYAIGEMLDWDAPTGGYLIQGCFSMGLSLASHFNSPTFPQ